MGKWTQSRYDEVLNSKFKSLVSGAIKRARLEKIEPTLSYESFVEDLDAGDSFTSTIIDCLVKEMADRKKRPTANDRRLIAESTARNLRSLASPFRVYWGRQGSSVSRRHATRRPTADYITSPPHDLDYEEDEEIFVDNFSNTTDGETITSDGPMSRNEPHEPGAPNINISSMPSLFMPRQPSPPMSLSMTIPEGYEPAMPASVMPSWASSPPTAATSTTRLHTMGMPLSRHSSTSIRRPPRSRTVDFNDFTSRRRTSIRDSLRDTVEASSSRDRDRDASSALRPDSVYIRPVGMTRRFFPGARRHRERDLDYNAWNDLTEFEETGLSSTFVPPQWIMSPPEVDSPPPEPIAGDGETLTSDERTTVSDRDRAPRLRRGGVRAPESILSRHITPIVVRASTFSPPPGISELVAASASASLPPSAGGSPRLPSEPAVGYPTPSSADGHDGEGL